MSEYDSSDSYDESDSSAEYFDVWTVASNRQEASAEIAERVETIKKAYNEMLAIANEFDVRVHVTLENEFVRGHNQAAYIDWNPSSQHC